MRRSSLAYGAAGLLATAALAAIAPVRTQAKPEYTQKEGKSCGYCHVKADGGGPRNYRGRYYRRNSYSFASFDNVAEAKNAGVEPLPEETSPVTPPPAAPAVDPRSVPDFGEWTHLGITYVKIPAGVYRRGTSPAQRAELEKKGMWTTLDTVEQPARQVTLTRPFLLSKTEVTQAQWKAVMNGKNPSAFKGDDLPVESITHPEAQSFCKSLSAKEPDARYRLPTEAEWEYAARAGSEGIYGLGPGKAAITTDNLTEYAWVNANSGNKTHAVGTKKPNAWGLHDMHGNVWEWCEDTYSPTAYADLPEKDPIGKTPMATERVLRGGCWLLDARGVRVSLRGGNLPAYKSQYAGLRVVREL